MAVRLKGLIRTFKINDAVLEDGDGARVHVGAIAEDVKAVLEAECSVAEQCAIICYDEWLVHPEVLDGEGSVN